jgi:outer membrane receptor protein involved in Fe transport
MINVKSKTAVKPIILCFVLTELARAADITGAVDTPPNGLAIAGSGDTLEEIVVTAQKRQQTANSVGMSITAITGEQLKLQGINNVSDLTKIIPGLTVQTTSYSVPVYTLRGVGFYETSLGSPPAVSVYVDEVPLPYSAMTRLAAFDVQRVEALKGPQGTLYGQNATGGAVNYVGEKPTDIFAAGTDISYGRFNTADVQGYVSGPVSSNAQGRLAVRTVQSSDWQRSYTHDATLGSTNQVQLRGTLDWQPIEKLKTVFTVTAWQDKSDTVAPQLIAVTPAVPANISPLLVNYPVAPANARAADWTPGLNLSRDDSFYQGAFRADYAVADRLTVTSVSAYERYKTEAQSDSDGTTLADPTTVTTGRISTFTQELRLSGSTDRLNWIIGANYENDSIDDQILPILYGASNTTIFGITFNESRNATTTDVNTRAGFGNVEFKALDTLRLQAGARYTRDDRKFNGCTYDVDGGISDIFTILEGAVTGTPQPPLVKGACATLNANGLAQPYTHSLDEDNVSWRVGLDWNPAGGDSLVYANVSKGYKAGSFPTAAASSQTQFKPVTQESILAYETGVKVPAFDHKLQFNGALFYYDYKNKQLRGKVVDPIFGPLDALVNIPKSRVDGAEAQLLWRPVSALTLNLSATYVETKISAYNGYNSAGVLGDYSGTSFPYSPKLQVVGDAQYRRDLNDRLASFIGGGVTYHSRTSAGIGSPQNFNIDSYALLDLRAGIESQDGLWRLMLWGRNVTDRYYWDNVTKQNDTTYRYAGMPATFGITGSLRFH